MYTAYSFKDKKPVPIVNPKFTTVKGRGGKRHVVWGMHKGNKIMSFISKEDYDNRKSSVKRKPSASRKPAKRKVKSATKKRKAPAKKRSTKRR